MFWLVRLLGFRGLERGRGCLHLRRRDQVGVELGSTVCVEVREKERERNGEHVRI